MIKSFNRAIMKARSGSDKKVNFRANYLMIQALFMYLLFCTTHFIQS